MRKKDGFSSSFFIHQIGEFSVQQGKLTSRFLKTDFTRDEVLLFPLVSASLQTPYSDCVKRDETLHAYSLEEKMAEKLCAILGRTEPRDLFDIHYLLTHHMVDMERVSFQLGEKMHPKGLDPSELEHVLQRRQKSLNRLWEPRLIGQMLTDLPPINMVIRETNRLLDRLVFFKETGASEAFSLIKPQTCIADQSEE